MFCSSNKLSIFATSKKAAVLFGAMGFFLSKNDRFKATEPEKPEQPSGCEYLEDGGRRRGSGVLKKKLSNTF